MRGEKEVKTSIRGWSYGACTFVWAERKQVKKIFNLHIVKFYLCIIKFPHFKCMTQFFLIGLQSFAIITFWLKEFFLIYFFFFNTSAISVYDWSF